MGLFKKDLLKTLQAKQKSRKYTILLVDDEYDNLITLSDKLSDEYNILTAMDGLEALELIKNDARPERIHLIISDQRMPRMSGVEFLEKTLNIIPRTKRIILTAFADINTILESVNRAQIYKFIAKPFEHEDILLTIRRALEAYELEGENLRLIQELKELNAGLEEKVQERTHELNRKNRQMLQELKFAREVQNAIMPPFPENDYLKSVLYYVPYEKVSGDTYYWDQSPDNVFRCFVGDAIGHGVPAAFITMMVHMVLRSVTPEYPPQDAMSYLDSSLGNCLPEAMFMSGVYALVTPDGFLRLAKAGHPPVIVLSETQEEPILLGAQGAPLGIFPTTRWPYSEQTYQLEPGDRILLYTDGAIERKNPEGTLFGFHRFLAFLGKQLSIEAEALLEKLLQHLESFSNGIQPVDDVTILILQYQPPTS